MRWERLATQGLGALVLLWLSAGAPTGALAQRRADEAERVQTGGVYRRPLANDPATLDPARITDIYGRAVAQQIFDGLVAYDHTLAVTPALATYWRGSRDGLTWTFSLRKGVKFHNGRELVADDVVYSFTRLLDPRLKSPGADLFGHVKGAREFREGRGTHVEGLVAADRHTVRVSLVEAQASFVSSVASAVAKIVPRDVAEAAGEAFGLNPVGTGPFRFVRWDRAKEIVLAPNPGYFDGAPRLGQVVFRVFPGAPVETMHAEFKRGALEDAPVPARDYREIVGSKEHVYFKRPTLSHRHYGFNLRWKPLADRRVRQAIVHAFDRATAIETAFLGRYELARGILPPGMLAYNPDVKGFPYDPKRAQELLAQAGFPGGRGLPPLPIWSSAKHEGILKEHAQLKQQLEAVGIRAEFNYLTNWPQFLKQLEAGAYPVFLHAWYADAPDPETFLYKLFYSGSPRNFFGYANPVVDDLLLRARAEQDLQRRVQLYRQIELLILADAPFLPVWHYTYERLFQPHVRGIEVNGLGDRYIPLRKVWLARAS